MHSRFAANLLIIFIFVMYSISLIQQKSYWPFIPYDMYCEYRATEIDIIKLHASDHDGNSSEINLSSIFKTRNKDHLKNSLLFIHGESQQKLETIIRNKMYFYNEKYNTSFVNFELVHVFLKITDQKNKKYEILKKETLASSSW